jgi:Tfp pilus assembly protein PilF
MLVNRCNRLNRSNGGITRATFSTSVDQREESQNRRPDPNYWRKSIPPVLALMVFFAGGCSKAPKLPDPSSAEYRQSVGAFYVGLAALQAGADARAETEFVRVTELAPDEPAGWANLGLLAMRQREFETAVQRLERAAALAPENSQIRTLIGLLEVSRGRSAEAITQLRRAVELDPANSKAVYSLAQEIERLGDDRSEAEAQSLLEKLLESQPDNLAILLEVTRLAAKRGDSATLQKTVAHIAASSSSWPVEAREQLGALQAAAAGADPRVAGTRVAFLRNVLVRAPEYRNSLAAVRLPQGEVGQPFIRFIKLPSPGADPAPADQALAFEAAPVTDSKNSGWTWTGHVYLDGETAPVQLVANASQMLAGGYSINFPGGGKAPPAAGIVALDFNYDFRTDLVLAGAGGVRLFKQEQGRFADVTASTRLPGPIVTGAYAGAWVADYEMDGDLDIVLGPADGQPLVLRNNGDGTFREVRPFEGVSQVRGFTWADLDADGDPDATLLDAQGGLWFFANERGGQFRSRSSPQGLDRTVAINVADANGDGVFDLVALQSNGRVLRISDRGEGRDLDPVEILRVSRNVGQDSTGATRLLVADVDNNGASDLVIATADAAEVWLGEAGSSFSQLASSIEARILSVADLTNDGRLDLAGIAGDGKAIRLVNRGGKSYHWQTVRARAATATGDQRINTFGIGGHMEIRSGLIFQMQPIAEPVVHFGVGEQSASDVIRIVWPNGAVQAEFEPQSDQRVLAEQRLKGSCPSLFAYDGSGMRFVKDCPPWSPAIGLRINLQQTLRISQTEEWVKIRGDQLAPKDGYYDLRITAELWETYYNDHYSLMVVDHPVGVDVFADERTSRPPPLLGIYSVAAARPFPRAWDDGGQDVTDVVRSLDSQYLDNFGRGQYQGLTRDHYVELELDETAPRSGPLWLIAHGWLHPTDASVNIAISQNSQAPPRGLRLEVPDGKGGWVVARDSLGFPAGKNKTILIDLNGVFRSGTPRRFRLRTNMEIYWDKLEWSIGLPESQLKTQRLNAETADLRYRGFSVMTRANQSSPELPEYDRVATTAQLWRDLVGYYTRLGDIRELLAHVDDRIVIMNAGDEIALRFQAPPAPPEGWVRDFVLIGNGWIKDGDFNSMFSKTVLPLPARDITDYTTLPPRLEDDPVYRRHKRDWEGYHTRYISTESFQNTLNVRK